MTFNIWRFRFTSYFFLVDEEVFPVTKLGIGWDFNWFHTIRLHALNKTIRWGPSANFYVFIGKQYLTISLEYFPKRSEHDHENIFY